ncbi:MAG: methyltransferase domain-containing protein [Candidatus Omnitrophica bacterium]|nr:methyltransferase domain-containing protein [Candidatus Omnitrophota bacterium]
MQVNEEKLNLFLDRVVSDLASSYVGIMVSLGSKLGLYQAMAGAGPLTSSEIAQRAGCGERYVREWLNAQSAAGYLLYHPESETYELSPEQAMVLANSEGPVYFPPAWEVPASMWHDEDQAIEAFRTGNGVPWGSHHERLYCGTAAFFRTAYKSQLVSNWIPAVEGLVEKLERGAKVADVGCGYGVSTRLMAEAFPNSTFFGYDSHEGSIAIARENAREEGLDTRATFEIATAKDYPNEGFDLICFFDCLHDMGDPIGAAKHAKECLAEDGTVMLIEPFARDRVEENLNPVGTLYYSASSMLCCAHSLSEEVGMALGAQAGEKRLADVFREAGFRTFRKASETPFNLILEAKP